MFIEPLSPFLIDVANEALDSFPFTWEQHPMCKKCAHFNRIHSHSDPEKNTDYQDRYVRLNLSQFLLWREIITEFPDMLTEDNLVGIKDILNGRFMSSVFENAHLLRLKIKAKDLSYRSIVDKEDICLNDHQMEFTCHVDNGPAPSQNRKLYLISAFRKEDSFKEEEVEGLSFKKDYPSFLTCYTMDVKNALVIQSGIYDGIKFVTTNDAQPFLAKARTMFKMYNFELIEVDELIFGKPHVVRYIYNDSTKK